MSREVRDRMVTASVDKLFANIPHLKSERDWLVWKFQVMHALKATDLWGYITETVEGATEIQRQKAFHCILQCIGQKYVPMVMSCMTPKQMWDTLCQFFERKTVNNKVFTLMQFYGLRMKKGARISDHLRKLDELTDQLTAIGEEVKEIHKVAVLVRSVQESYSTLVTALLARGDDDLTMVFVKQSLLDEEQRRGKGGSDFGATESQGDESALKAGRGKFGKGRKPGNCYNCGQSGHFARNCPTQSVKGQKSNPPRHRAKKAEEAQDDYDSEEESQTFVAMSGLKAEERCEDWITDSGASRHMTFQKELLRDYREFKTPQSVGLGDGHAVEALGAGRIKFTTEIRGGKKIPSWMTDVLYVPKLAGNLFSVCAATQNQKVISFGHKYCWIRDKRHRPVASGSTVSKLYKLKCEVHKPSGESAQTAKESQDSGIELWHQRLAHVNYNQLRQLEKNASGLSLPRESKRRFCEACIQGKMHRKPHKPLKEIRSTEKLQLVHTDVCGPMQTKSFGGSRYFITFTDDYSRCCKVYFLKEKSEALEKFKEFKASVETESGQSIKTLRADRGGEYLSKEFSCYLKKYGIRAELTAAHSPQQNGVSERMKLMSPLPLRKHSVEITLNSGKWQQMLNTSH